MSILQYQSGSGVGVLESNRAADQLFRTFLNDFTLSKVDLNRREVVLVELPTHLKEASRGQVGNVVLFPFGTFYHGIGFRNDPLTVYVTTGRPISRSDGKKDKSATSSQGRDHDDTNSSDKNGDDDDNDNDSSNSDNGGDDDDYSSTGSIHSTDSESQIEGCNNMSTSEEEAVSTRDDNRMRQELLLNINDLLIDPENCLGGVYKDVTLTSQGKLYFIHQQLGYLSSPNIPLNFAPEYQNMACFLQAKSFLPVQMSRLVKFYCLLEQLFWPFSQLVLNWTKNYEILELEDNTSTDGLKQEHVLSLVIFFLVRRRIIPSFQLLQKWSTSQLVIMNEGEKINVGFCEDIDVVRQNCLKMGIGSGPEEWTLERILQLLYDFFNEMSTFDFGSWGLQVATGNSFCKSAPFMRGFEKRTLYRKTPLCIQHVLDEFVNCTRKVNESCVLKLRTRCKDAADRLLPSLWTGDLLNAVLGVLDAESSFRNAQSTTTKALTNWQDSIAYQINYMGELRRCIKFRVPPRIVQLLQHCLDLSMGVQSEVQKEPLGFSSAFVFRQGMKTLFEIFVEEFNNTFWTKFVAARVLQTGGAGDPRNFNFVDPLQCPVQLSKAEKATCVVRAVMNLNRSFSWGTASTQFYAMKDWTKKSSVDIPANVDKSKVTHLVHSFLAGVKSPQIVYGQRYGPPRESQIMAVVELDITYDEKEGICVFTFVRAHDDAPELQHYLNWYNALIKTFVIQRFIRWMGSSVVTDLEENCARLMKMRLANKKKGNVVQRKSTTAPTSTVSIPANRSSFTNESTAQNARSVCYTGGGNQFSGSISASTNSVRSRVVKVSNNSVIPNPGGFYPLMAFPSMALTANHSAPGAGRGRGRGKTGRGGRGSSAQLQHAMRFGRGMCFGKMAHYTKPY